MWSFSGWLLFLMLNCRLLFNGLFQLSSYVYCGRLYVEISDSTREARVALLYACYESWEM